MYWNTFWLLPVSICEAFSENYDSVNQCMINFFECFWNNCGHPGTCIFQNPFAKAQKIVYLIQNQYVFVLRYNTMRFLTNWYIIRNKKNIFYRKLKIQIITRRLIRIKQFHPIMLIEYIASLKNCRLGARELIWRFIMFNLAFYSYR